MTSVREFRSRQQLEADANLREFIRSSREVFESNAGDGDEWEASAWTGVRWAKLDVGRRRRFGPAERIDAAFIDFAKAYYVWKSTERPSTAGMERQALKCIESALVLHTGSGSIRGLSYAVLDLAAAAAGERFSEQTAYHVGRHLRLLAQFVSDRHLISRDVSTWKSPLTRPCSVRRTGDFGDGGLRSPMPAEAALYAMAEIFANDPADPPVRFASAVWALLMCAPWRIGEVLRLHVDAEHEATDDDGVVSYGFRYFGLKGFGHDVKWIPKTMEPVARQAFRRLRELTASARALAAHLQRTPDKPFLYEDAPRVDVDAVLGFEDKAAYLRRPVPKRRDFMNTAWKFGSIREHWARARAELPDGFPVFDVSTGLKWPQALFCLHRDLLHATRPTDWYALAAPTANTVNDLLGASSIKEGIFSKLGYRDTDGSPLRLTTHQARHYLSTLAERGAMADEDLAKWAGRALVRDNRVYNHVSEDELADRNRDAIAGTTLGPSSSSPRTFIPTTPAEFNMGERGPTHRTEFGVCEHDWVLSPCMKKRDCINCSEHMCVKGDAQALERIKANHEHHAAECTKALDAIVAGARVADRWLEHGLKSLVRMQHLLCLLEDDSVPDGSAIRLADDSAEHTHLRRALTQRLPHLRDPSLPDSVKRLVAKYCDGRSPDEG